MSEKTQLGIAIGLALIVLMYLLHKLALWAEKKGWIYYTQYRRGAISQTAIHEVDLIVNPQSRHTIEAKQHIREEMVIDEGGKDRPAIDKRLIVRDKL